MTTLQIQPSATIRISSTEDAMELSSDIERRVLADEDVDIDLDLAGDNAQDQDEFMDEDGNVLTDTSTSYQQETLIGNDDEMADDEYQQGVNGEDEHLGDVDYTEPDASDAHDIYSSFDHTLFDGREPASSLQAEFEANTESPGSIYPDANLTETNTTQDTSGWAIKKSLEEFKNAGDPGVNRSNVRQEHSAESVDCVIAADAQVILEQPEPEKDSDDEASIWQQGHAEFEERRQKKELAAPVNLDAMKDREHSSAQGESILESSAYVHPVVIIYLDNEISLFPPFDQEQEHSETYFLEDEQLAGDSIRNLLWACRSVLGDSLSVKDDLVIIIEDLSLRLSESSVESASTTLAQLIDIFIRLQNNDGVEVPPPLYMILETATKYTSRLDFLLTAVEEGKGLSQVVPIDNTQQAQPGDFDVSPQNQNEVRKQKSSESRETSEVQQQKENDLNEKLENHDAQSPTKVLPRALRSHSPSKSSPEAYHPSSETESDAAALSRAHNTWNETTNETYHHSDAVFSITQTDASLDLPAGSLNDHSRSQTNVDDEDFIDYEEDDPTHETSSGSSTLGGDTSESAPICVVNGKKSTPTEENHLEDEDVTYVRTDEKDSDAFVEVPRAEPAAAVDNEAHDLSNERSLPSDLRTIESLEREDPHGDSGSGGIIYRAKDETNHFGDDHPTKLEDRLNDRLEAVENELSNSNIDKIPPGNSSIISAERSFSCSTPVSLDNSDSFSYPKGEKETAEVSFHNNLREVDQHNLNGGLHVVDANLQSPELKAGLENLGDDDQITFEEEDDDLPSSRAASKVDQTISPSLDSLKRPRSFDEKNESFNGNVQDIKRIRSE